jgi:hypothetical protein
MGDHRWFAMIVFVSGIAIGGTRNVPLIDYMIAIDGNRPSIAITIETPDHGWQQNAHSSRWHVATKCSLCTKYLP